MMRLDKLLAHSGYGSRKEVKEYIRKGYVIVNGEVITNDDFDNHGPEYESIIDNITGSFFRNNDVNDLVDKIKQWALVDAATRHECRLRARATVENEWSVNYQVDVLKKALFAE